MTGGAPELLISAANSASDMVARSTTVASVIANRQGSNPGKMKDSGGGKGRARRWERPGEFGDDADPTARAGARSATREAALYPSYTKSTLPTTKSALPTLYSCAQTSAEEPSASPVDPTPPAKKQHEPAR